MGHFREGSEADTAGFLRRLRGGALKHSGLTSALLWSSEKEEKVFLREPWGLGSSKQWREGMLMVSVFSVKEGKLSVR